MRQQVVAVMAVMAWLGPTVARADVLTFLSFKGRGVESVGTLSNTREAINTWGFQEISSGYGAPIPRSTISDTMNLRWESLVAAARANPFAAVDGLDLKTRANIEGVLAEKADWNTCVWLDPDCPPQGSEDYYWNSFAFETYAEAFALEQVVVSGSSSTPTSLRLVLTVDGINDDWIDWFVSPVCQGCTGGGYQVNSYLRETVLGFSSSAVDPWTYDLLWESSLRYDGGDDAFNHRLPYARTAVKQGVLTPAIPVGPLGSTPINLWLSSRAQIDVENLDSGRVLFGLDADYSHTVKLEGFEVFDANGRLLTDAIVTGSDGRVYRTLGGTAPPVPEPVSVVLVGLGLLGAGTRVRRARRA